MKFVLTMNMPSSQGFLVHQIILDHEAGNIAQFCDLLNDEMFIYGRQFYKRVEAGEPPVFVDRGPIIVNTSHIGKAQEYYESDVSEGHTERQRPPMRKRTHNQY